jgi:diguanylate cyclase (GGDEF)-like protein
MIDNTTLLIAIGFSSAALVLTFFVGWLNTRQDHYLLSWAAGLAFVVLSLILMAFNSSHYETGGIIAQYAGLLTGLALVHLGVLQFRFGPVSLLGTACTLLTGLAATTIPFLLGYSGLGTIALNAACAVWMFMSGYHYWAGRREAPVPLLTGAALFMLAALSFVACASVLVSEGEMVLTAPPANWAEELNSIMMIVGLTGLGALSLTLSQYRATRLHRAEAQTDSLSGLLNRRALFDTFGATPTAGMAVLMFDIDHFKQINDKNGHAAGDAVIKHFASVLKQHLRDSDTAARLGGEEFCAILPPLPMEQARVVAERVRSAFELTPTRLVPDVIPATVSVGLAVCGPAEPFSSVLNRADDALYKAKNNGRNRVTMAPAVRLIA